MDPLHIILTCSGAFILFLLGVVWQISERKISALTLKCDANSSDLAAYKLKIAEEYVSRDTLREMEDRIMKALDAVSETQGKIFEELKSKADK